MNPSDEHLLTIDDQQFDLLADGELSDAERRRLLESLDDTPGGWRQCALAFLEAQCWKDELVHVTREPTVQPQAGVADRRRSWTGGMLGTVLAMAASLALAFVLGGVLWDAWSGGGPAGSGQNLLVVEGTQDDASIGAQEARVPEDAVVESSPPVEMDPRWQMVEFPVDRGPDQEPEMIRIPARHWQSMDDRWRETLTSRAPQQFLDGLRRSGLRFREDQRLLPVPLEDGGQLVVPVHEVEFVDGPVFH